MAVTWKKLAYEDDVVLKTAFGNYGILASGSAGAVAAVALAASQMIGRKSTGDIVALAAADIRTIANVADGATANAKATGAELDTATDDAKFATAKAIKDAHNVPSVVPGASGNVLTSNGTDWTSGAAGAPAAHALSAHTVAVANLLMGGFQAEDQVVQTVANVAAVNAYATPVLGKMLWSTAELAMYLCTSVA